MKTIALTFSVANGCTENERRILRQAIIEVLADSRVRDRLPPSERRLVERLLVAEGDLVASRAEGN